jgi:hypothetical protein
MFATQKHVCVCICVESSEPRAKSVSVSFESASAKRLTGSPATAKLIDPTNTSMTSSLDGSSTVTAGSVLALESMSQPGELEQLVLTAVRVPFVS